MGKSAIIDWRYLASAEFAALRRANSEELLPLRMKPGLSACEREQSEPLSTGGGKPCCAGCGRLDSESWAVGTDWSSKREAASIKD